ncbi:MAG: hypothetical protein PHI40_00330 [Caldisericia bacterium]|nr:hypothetical protein [Caldisericia bacterium]
MTLQVGDGVVVIPLRDGGRVAVRSGTIAVGDNAVLIPGVNGQLCAVRPASPQVGDKVILYPLRNGGHVCLASADDEGGSSPSAVLVTLRDWRMATEIGEVIDYGTAYYHWDGQGQVWLSRSPTTKASIFWDNEIRVSTQYGTLDWHQGPQIRIPEGLISYEIVEITSYLRPGPNHISIQIRDSPSAPTISWVGAYTDIYVMRAAEW